MSQPKPAPADPATAARRLIRRAAKAALATIHARTGYPYASLITVATQPDCSPIFLISRLAQHTQNLLADNRASILFDGTDGLGDPLQGGRVSLHGRAHAVDGEAVRRRFLARHPEAAGYADFGDFSFYRLDAEGAHYVGGFGRIHDLAADDLRTPVDDAGALIEAEAEIVAHMNSDHADAVELYATRLLGASPGAWRFVACDPEGCDLALADRMLRLEFPERVTTPEAARRALVELVRKARAMRERDSP